MDKLRYLVAKQKGVFTYYGHSYDLEPITPPEVNLRNILVIEYPLDVKICQDNPHTLQNAFFEAARLPGFPKPLTVPPHVLPKGSRLMLLRGGGIGDVIMLTPALMHLKKVVGNSITITLSTFAERIPIIDGLGCIDKFFPHPISLFDFMQESDYYMDFADPKLVFNDMDMIDFHLDSLYFDTAAIPDREKVPRISDELRHSRHVLEGMDALDLNGLMPVLYAPKASHAIRHLPPGILDLLALKYPEVAFILPSDTTGAVPGFANVFSVNTTHGLGDFVTAIDQCEAVVCSDSSAYHIASALDIPALVFFGPIGSAIRTKYYPKVTALDSCYTGVTCHAPCGISALLETPPTIAIGANRVKELTEGVEITTTEGHSFRFDPHKGCPEANALGSAFSPCMEHFTHSEIIDGFAQTISLIQKRRMD